MSDDYDAQKDKDDEMLADYHSDLIHEERQANCYHENIYTEDARVRVILPKDTKKGQLVVTHNFDVEANFICDNCGKSGWFSVNVEEYIEGIDDPNILDD